MVTQHHHTAPRNHPVPVLPQVATVECQCGTIHNSADGRVPVGWTVSRGEAFCTDCTRKGIPARAITSPRPRQSSAAEIGQAESIERVRLRGEAIALLVHGQSLMPLNSKQRVEWIKRVNAMLDTMAQRAA